MFLAAAVARLLCRVAAIFLVAMVAINVIDVGLRSTINQPIFGTYEIVELFLAAAVFLAIPEAFFRGQHITIELIDQVVPPRVVDFLKLLGVSACAVFLGLLTYHMIQPAIEFVEFNDVTADLQYPIIWRAAFVLAGIAFSALAALVLFVNEINMLSGRRHQS